MSDRFDTRGYSPMLIGETGGALDDWNYLYELKLDGARCLAYLDPIGGTALINKRDLLLNKKFPELLGIHGRVKRRCVLDGELIVMVDGRPSFAELQRRTILSNAFRIELAASALPACLVAYDILYADGEDLSRRPLTERRELLQEVVAESPLLSLSRVFESGVLLFELTVEQGLEGVVAKRRDSRYHPGKRTRDWIKIKNLKDDDFIVCGYIEKSGGVVSLVLGQLDSGQMISCGHVTLGVSGRDFDRIKRLPREPSSPFADTPAGDSGANWVKPQLVCRVGYMERTASGHMRQPVFHGLRDDKAAEDCVRL